MPLTDEERRELVAWFMDVRLRGVHPDWIVIWCGANKHNLRDFLKWTRGDSCHWPIATHMRPPAFEAAGGIFLNSYKSGLPIWEQLQKE